MAHRLDAADLAGVASLPLFEIAEEEMASGIFRDVERAINAPDVEVDKGPGRYVIHRDYSNSEKLNEYMAGGGRAFVVRYRGTSYRVDVRYMKR